MAGFETPPVDIEGTWEAGLDLELLHDQLNALLQLHICPEEAAKRPQHSAPQSTLPSWPKGTGMLSSFCEADLLSVYGESTDKLHGGALVISFGGLVQVMGGVPLQKVCWCLQAG